MKFTDIVDVSNISLLSKWESDHEIFKELEIMIIVAAFQGRREIVFKAADFPQLNLKILRDWIEKNNFTGYYTGKEKVEDVIYKIRW